jgi:hypothetical protein
MGAEQKNGPRATQQQKGQKKIKEEKKGQKCWGMDRLDESF